ncbi:response regulator [Palleronia sp. LCG004]|uniref:response regulator n=1 Tax=Palleronia sp. LCG004 TaxID=3079304 RepID=UPI0029421319|nr:response regulator [Palleronia sp. LCG004]WOI56218.1 response regulator [Palleronia sp. LCG004]
MLHHGDLAGDTVQRSGGGRVLIVDDDPFILLALGGQVADLGYAALSAESGREALKLLAAHADIGLVLLDRVMPEMDGVEVVRKMKAEAATRNIPVIMVTGTDDPAEIRMGIEAGVFYHLAKPVDTGVLASVMSAALRRARELSELAKGGSDTLGFALTRAARFEIRTLSEAESLSGFLANHFTVPERVLPGIGALLVNAIEHGLCGIGYEAKGRLLRDGIWREEVDRRAAACPADRLVQVAFMRREDGDVISVTDPGPGFHWRDYMSIDTSRSASTHGRGLLQARTLSFDLLRFNATGNQAVGVVRNGKELEW